jgi:hypothetical protein
MDYGETDTYTPDDDTEPLPDTLVAGAIPKRLLLPWLV